MPANRYFVDAPFVSGEQAHLAGEERDHLVKVMRKRENETLELVNGKGELAFATISLIDKQAAHLDIVTVERKSPTKTFILCQALPKVHHLDWIVEKGTELGMSALWLFPGERSEKKGLSDNQLKRIHHLTISALKQCGRLWLPEITLKPALSEWQSIAHPAFYGSLNSTAPFSSFLPQNALCFFVGPEGGFSSEEERKLDALGASGVTLHPNILRTETASLVALSQFFS